MTGLSLEELRNKATKQMLANIDANIAATMNKTPYEPVLSNNTARQSDSGFKAHLPAWAGTVVHISIPVYVGSKQRLVRKVLHAELSGDGYRATCLETGHTGASSRGVVETLEDLRRNMENDLIRNMGYGPFWWVQNLSGDFGI